MSDYTSKVSVDLYTDKSPFPQRTLTGSLEWVYEMLGKVVADERQWAADRAEAMLRHPSGGGKS